MSAPKATPDTHVWQKTETPGVYRRSDYFIALVRPDGKRKVVHRFETYAEAAAFKATTPSVRRTRPADAKSTTVEEYDCRPQLIADPCAYCGGPGGAVDHVVPRWHGGDDDWTNMTSACLSCNSKKGTRPLLLFLAYRRGCWRFHHETT